MSNVLVDTLRTFFPNEQYSDEKIVNGVASGNILVNPSALVNYLQSALHDESLLEVELGNVSRVFFCRVLDDPPALSDDEKKEPEEEDSDDFFFDLEEEYDKGDYLNEMDHLILTPLEPAEGNYLINSAPTMVVRALTSQAAIEFCCFFKERARIVDGMQVLKLSFPEVARQVKGAREYRVKVPAEMNIEVTVKKRKSDFEFFTRPVDISMNGMSLHDPMGKKTDLRNDDRVVFKVSVNDEQVLEVGAVVRHLTRLRDAKGLQYIFGTKFEFESKHMAREIERLVASIQRERLRMLSEIEGEYGLDLTDW